MKLEGIKMGCLGDSITEGVGVKSLENMYYNRLQGFYLSGIVYA